MFHWLLSLYLLLLPFASPCPSGVDVRPCECASDELTCRGAVGLPRLTAILRQELCGARLAKVWLTESDVGYLPSNLFYKMRVREIQVTYTNISHFTEAGRSAFYGLERHLESLSMRWCRLVNGLQWQMIGDLSVLTYLDLSFNDLTEVPRVWFREPPMSLRSLILKGNRIETLHRNSLSRMYNLVELDLSENRISKIERNVLPYPANNLIFLRLSYNLLERLSEDFFIEMFGLRRLYLDSNRLRTLPRQVWAPIWGDLLLLDLSSNELHCNCDMQWAAKLLPPKQLYAECAHLNSSLDGKEIKDLWPWDFDCDHSTTTTH